MPSSSNMTSSDIKSDTALLLIDVINDLDFEGNEEILKAIPELIKSITLIRRVAKTEKIPTIYVNDNFHKWRSSFEEILKYCRREDAPGRRLAESLVPDKDDFFILKPMHSIFYCTPLELLLSELEVKTLILCGLAGNICVLFSANDAHMRNYELIVPSDCIASNSRKDNDFALDQMKQIHGARIGIATEIASLLQQREKGNTESRESNSGRSLKRD